jgi:hypothetical protein
MDDIKDLEAAAKVFQGKYNIPLDVIILYARLWKLETWLREMVYVELKSDRGPAWSASIKDVTGKVAKDKRLIHMATRERGPLSYLTLGELWEVMSSPTNWPIFESYFPPKTLIEAKFTTELMQIRHRVAHCRIPHSDDLVRVEQFLRDIDQSFWNFITSYNHEHPITPVESDPIAAAFISYDQYPWVEVKTNTWTRLDRKELDASYTVTIAWSLRPWVVRSSLRGSIAPNPGVVYDINFQALDSGSIDYEKILKRTMPLHERCIHIVLNEAASSMRLTIPSVLTVQDIIETIEVFRDEVTRGINPSLGKLDGFAKIAASRWPEYVIGPENPLAFLCPDMPCRIFPS